MIYIPYYYVVLFSYGEAHQILPQVKLIWQNNLRMLNVSKTEFEETECHELPDSAIKRFFIQ